MTDRIWAGAKNWQVTVGATLIPAQCRMQIEWSIKSHCTNALTTNELSTHVSCKPVQLCKKITFKTTYIWQHSVALCRRWWEFWWIYLYVPTPSRVHGVSLERTDCQLNSRQTLMVTDPFCLWDGSSWNETHNVQNDSYIYVSRYFTAFSRWIFKDGDCVTSGHARLT